jgi:hypothetical protein
MFFFCYYPATISIIKIACIQVVNSSLFQLLSAPGVFQLQFSAKAPSIDTKVSLMEAQIIQNPTAPEP